MMDVDLDGSGEFESTTPTALLQNLEGRWSIMGRSISMVEVDGNGDRVTATILDCCSIVYEDQPDSYSPQAAYLEGATDGAPYSPYAVSRYTYNQYGGFGLYGGYTPYGAYSAYRY